MTRKLARQDKRPSALPPDTALADDTHTLEILDCMKRAARSMTTSLVDLKDGDPDGAASRAYYAAFHALRALFLLEGKAFKKHSSLESAVHKDLVHTGRWPEKLAQRYKYLFNLRSTADYGGMVHASTEDAKRAIEYARSIIDKVAESGVPTPS